MEAASYPVAIRFSLKTALRLRRAGDVQGMGKSLPELEKAYTIAVQKAPELPEVDQKHVLEHWLHLSRRRRQKPRPLLRPRRAGLRLRTHPGFAGGIQQAGKAQRHPIRVGRP